MPQRLCPRCRHVVSFEDESSLVYCGNCGAPQISVSEELLEQNARLTASLGPSGERIETEEERSARLAAQPPDQLIQWKSALRITLAVCGAISLACLFPVIQVAGLLAWLAPGVVLGIYTARHRETKISAGMGARIGLICGLLSAFGISVAMAIEMLLMRTVFHQGSLLDASMMKSLMQIKANGTRSGADASAFIDPLLLVPEFRAGAYLLSLLFMCLVLMAFSTANGAFSGYLRSRRTAR